MAYYQVPNKSLGEFNITNDKVYTQTLNSDLEDTNFGELAKLSAVPVATDSTIGGIRLYPTNGGSGTIDSAGKKYAVQLNGTSDNPYAYTYVPWINTLYKADERAQYLCMEWDQEPVYHEGLSTDGGLMRIGLSVVPVKLLSGTGDMVDGDLQTAHFYDFTRVNEQGETTTVDGISTMISKPLQTNIDNAITEAEDNLSRHNSENRDEFTSVHLSIHNLSDDIHDHYYLCTETSNLVELSNAFSELSTNFELYLRNKLYSGIRTNPAYLSDEVNDISAKLSNEIVRNYYQKADVYTKDETYPRTRLSTNTQLKNKFDTKQDNLNVNEQINTTLTYNKKDVATVSAIIDFVNSSINKSTATFQGHFPSWEKVPDVGTSQEYVSPPPDKNDYIYVDLSDDNILHLSSGTWKFIMSSNKYDEHGQMIWDDDKGRNNWKAEYRITDTLFTDAQTKALNSGIRSDLVKSYSDATLRLDTLRAEFDSLSARLRALAFEDSIADNITGSGTAGQVAVFNDKNKLTGMNFSPKKEKWIFELQNEGKYVEKYILAQDV